MAAHNLVFVLPNGVKQTFELETAFHPQNNHIHKHLEQISCNGEHYNVFIWGENVYSIGVINKPIKIFGKFYQIVELIKFGHVYIVETSDDNGKTFESIFESKSFLSYENCYDDMKQLAMNDLGADIDIKQDFDFGEGDKYKREVQFTENQIEWKGGGKIMRYRIIQ